MDTKVDAENGPRAAPPDSKTYHFKTFLSSLNLIAHLAVGIVFGLTVVFVNRPQSTYNATNIHILLCVMGYQLLMSEAILSLAPHNGWSSHLKLVDKRRAHWILQILGAALAIAGSFVKIIDKSTHWNTPHGVAALVALVFSVVSLVNGLSSLWAYEVRRFIPPKLSKLTHICFGMVGFVAASVSLCYGFDKNMFRNWQGPDVADFAIALTAILTFIVIIAPGITFLTKFKRD